MHRLEDEDEVTRRLRELITQLVGDDVWGFTDDQSLRVQIYRIYAEDPASRRAPTLNLLKRVAAQAGKRIVIGVEDA